MKPCLFSILAGLTALVAPTAHATIIVKMDLPSLVGRSDVIFLGKAVKVESRWTPDRRRIVTDTTFEVEQVIKGQAEPARPAVRTITVRSLGGSVNGIGMRVSGTPMFSRDSRAVLFTEKRLGKRHVVGMKQGVFTVRANPAGKPMVRAELSGLTLAERSPAGRLQMLGHRETGETRSLNDFILHVRKLVAACAKEATRCRPR